MQGIGTQGATLDEAEEAAGVEDSGTGTRHISGRLGGQMGRKQDATLVQARPKGEESRQQLIRESAVAKHLPSPCLMASQSAHQTLAASPSLELARACGCSPGVAAARGTPDIEQGRLAPTACGHQTSSPCCFPVLEKEQVTSAAPPRTTGPQSRGGARSGAPRSGKRG